MVKVGSEAPGFCLPAADKDKVCLDDFKQQWKVVYFYPKDNTGG
jgi:peroxiredoxin Q/BCP